MIYLVTNQKDLFNSPAYTNITVEESLQIMSSWETIMFDTETSGRNPHVCKLLTAQFGTKDIQIVYGGNDINTNCCNSIIKRILIILLIVVIIIIIILIILYIINKYKNNISPM